ncbi:hypothetical protein F2Q68_00044416 [Brassica cretica]|uniref:Uncharacterized protein n=2 Tax=Brassica cretica TaxID=69181 RepID=A0ABQ7ASG6_BRACR|nr:hypothetical protein F2Q68_00044416 [Brassica cretica]KAF3516983.1 hypothetical protein DY000_02060519 [Brassica cretica]
MSNSTLSELAMYTRRGRVKPVETDMEAIFDKEKGENESKFASGRSSREEYL